MGSTKTAEQTRESRMSTCIRCRGEVICYDMGWPGPLLVCDKCKRDAANNTPEQWADLIFERRVVSPGYHETSRTIKVIVGEMLAQGRLAGAEAMFDRIYSALPNDETTKIRRKATVAAVVAGMDN